MDKTKKPRVVLDEGLNRLRKGGVNSSPPEGAEPPPPPPPQRIREGTASKGDSTDPPSRPRPVVRPQAEPPGKTTGTCHKCGFIGVGNPGSEPGQWTCADEEACMGRWTTQRIMAPPPPGPEFTEARAAAIGADLSAMTKEQIDLLMSGVVLAKPTARDASVILGLEEHVPAEPIDPIPLDAILPVIIEAGPVGKVVDTLDLILGQPTTPIVIESLAVADEEIEGGIVEYVDSNEPGPVWEWNKATTIASAEWRGLKLEIHREPISILFWARVWRGDRVLAQAQGEPVHHSVAVRAAEKAARRLLDADPKSIRIKVTCDEPNTAGPGSCCGKCGVDHGCGHLPLSEAPVGYKVLCHKCLSTCTKLEDGWGPWELSKASIRVTCDKTNNPPESVAKGDLNVTVEGDEEVLCSLSYPERQKLLDAGVPVFHVDFNTETGEEIFLGIEHPTELQQDLAVIGRASPTEDGWGTDLEPYDNMGEEWYARSPLVATEKQADRDADFIHRASTRWPAALDEIARLKAINSAPPEVCMLVPRYISVVGGIKLFANPTVVEGNEPGDVLLTGVPVLGAPEIHRTHDGLPCPGACVTLADEFGEARAEVDTLNEMAARVNDDAIKYKAEILRWKNNTDTERGKRYEVEQRAKRAAQTLFKVVGLPMGPERVEQTAQRACVALVARRERIGALEAQVDQATGALQDVWFLVECGPDDEPPATDFDRPSQVYRAAKAKLESLERNEDDALRELAFSQQEVADLQGLLAAASQPALKPE